MKLDDDELYWCESFKCGHCKMEYNEDRWFGIEYVDGAVTIAWGAMRN